MSSSPKPPSPSPRSSSAPSDAKGGGSPRSTDRKGGRLKGAKGSTPSFPATGEERPAPLGDAARHAVFRVLARQAKLYPDFDLSVMDKSALEAPMSELDRAFAYAIYDAVVRHWLTLEFLISRELSQPWADLEPRLKAALLGGSAQILLMDKVPTHAAINHAVEWAKKVIRPGAGGFTNAVLRKVAKLRPEGGESPDRPRRAQFTGQRDELASEDGSAVVLAEACLPEDELERLAIATSHPANLLRYWLQQSSIREVKRLAMHSMTRPPVILNSMYVKCPLPSTPTITPHNAPGHHVFSGTSSELAGLLETRDDVWVQDPGSALAVQGIADMQPKLILDLCAGQGTKTRQLAATFPNAKIVTTDVDPARLSTLERVFAGSEQVSVMSRRKIQERYIGKADLILLDVPCSNTGVLARRPEARLRFDAAHMKQLVDVQRQIIADCIPLLCDAPRGKILYSTCSLEPAENREQVLWADKWHKLGISRERRHVPEGGPGEAPERYCDGSFAAVLG